MGAAFKFLFKIMLGVVVLIAVIAQFNKPKTPPKAELTPEQIVEKEKQEAEFQRVVAAVRALKQSANNPKSFELESAKLTEQGAICIVFRAANAFGGIVLNYATITKENASMTSEAWRRSCEGKAAKDMTHAKYAVF